MLYLQLSQASKGDELRDRLSGAAIALALAAACLGSACANSHSSQTAPTPLPTTPTEAAPTPVATNFALGGRVTEAPPTTAVEVPRAVVTITDGVNAGRSAIADVYGFYSIKDLSIGPITVKVTADGFVSTTTGLDVNIAGQTTRNFRLMPVPKTMSYTMGGDLRGTDGTCSDGRSMKPCRIVVIPIHNEGMIDVKLDWEPAASADLELTLFQTGSETPIARAAGAGASQKRVSARVSGGTTYEFRITYASGTGAVNYTLTVSCPN
jgi:hypothetical protein